MASACAGAISERKALLPDPDHGLYLGPSEPVGLPNHKKSGAQSDPSLLCWPAGVTHFHPFIVSTVKVTYRQICKLSTLYLCRKQILQHAHKSSVPQWLHLPVPSSVGIAHLSLVICTERELINIVYLIGASFWGAASWYPNSLVFFMLHTVCPQLKTLADEEGDSHVESHWRAVPPKSMMFRLVYSLSLGCQPCVLICLFCCKQNRLVTQQVK